MSPQTQGLVAVAPVPGSLKSKHLACYEDWGVIGGTQPSWLPSPFAQPTLALKCWERFSTVSLPRISTVNDFSVSEQPDRLSLWALQPTVLRPKDLSRSAHEAIRDMSKLFISDASNFNLRSIQDVAFTLGTPDSIGHRESAVASGCKHHRYFKSKWNKTSNENSMLDIFQSAQRGRCDFGLRLPVGKRWENCLRCVLRSASYRRCCVKLLRCSSCFAESIVGISRCRPWPSVLVMAENINMDEQTDLCFNPS